MVKGVKGVARAVRVVRIRKGGGREIVTYCMFNHVKSIGVCQFLTECNTASA